METKRILYTNEQGGLSIVVPAPGCTLEQAIAAVPKLTSYEIVDVADIPPDRTFRDAWLHDTTPAPQKVAIDMPKAKTITHDRRRVKRAVEFAPHDETIIKQIPGKDVQAAEDSRVTIRTKYTVMQSSIDTCQTPEDLLMIIEDEGL